MTLKKLKYVSVYNVVCTIDVERVSLCIGLSHGVVLFLIGVGGQCVVV
jgi:hypothetical protein